MKDLSIEEKLVVIIPAYNEEKAIAKTIESLLAQSERPSALVVVDNNSTDSTARIVKQYQAHHPWMYLINEQRKGTGFACNAAAKYAIEELGATILARTDADTTVSKDWVKAIKEYFAKNPEKQMVSGPRPARKDDQFYCWYDAMVYVPFWWLMRLVGVVRSRKLYWMKLMPGHNLSIRAKAYLKTPGFALSHIGEVDEDVELFLAIYNIYGGRAFGWDRSIKVKTSARRIRSMGYLHLFLYYFQKPNHQRRVKLSRGAIDIR